jgi:Cytochrome B561, N terminal
MFRVIMIRRHVQAGGHTALQRHDAKGSDCSVLSPAEGTCVKEFTWNGGGVWQNRAWTPDLPTDAALLFYLFSAFLEAPRCAADLMIGSYKLLSQARCTLLCGTGMRHALFPACL